MPQQATVRERSLDTEKAHDSLVLAATIQERTRSPDVLRYIRAPWNVAHIYKE